MILSGTYTDEYVKLYGNACIENVEIGGNITIKTNQHITSQNEIEKLSQVPDSNLESEKYVFTNETKEYDGQTLYRIRALKDFGNVKAGELVDSSQESTIYPKKGIAGLIILLPLHIMHE